ncbi:MAG: hypothetical protein AAFQ61_04170 [Cyanobacteria bacterium J06626_23]
MLHRHATPRPVAVLVTLILLGGCAWVPEPPEVETQAVAASQPGTSEPVTPPEQVSEEPPVNAPQVTYDNAPNASTETEPEAVNPSDCTDSQPGQVIGLDEFYAATLKGNDNEQLYISHAPGAEPGDSYGLAGDAVEAIATALDDTCTTWTWVKWPESDYRGWLPASSIEITQ